MLTQRNLNMKINSQKLKQRNSHLETSAHDSSDELHSAKQLSQGEVSVRNVLFEFLAVYFC